MMKRLSILLALACMTVSTTGFARSVFLNGVDITGVRGQTFKNATVGIDLNGDIRIDAPGYKVEVVDKNTSPPPPPAPPPPVVAPPKAAKDEGGPNPLLEKRYYLVTQPSPGGRAQYDLAVSINGVEKKLVKAGSPQVIMEISAWLNKGENALVLTARKNLQGGRKSSAPTDEARIMVGTGHEEDKVVKIDNIRGKVTVNAASLSTVRKNFVIVAR